MSTTTHAERVARVENASRRYIAQLRTASERGYARQLTTAYLSLEALEDVPLFGVSEARARVVRAKLARFGIETERVAQLSEREQMRANALAELDDLSAHSSRRLEARRARVSVQLQTYRERVQELLDKLDTLSVAELSAGHLSSTLDALHSMCVQSARQLEDAARLSVAYATARDAVESAE